MTVYLENVLLECDALLKSNLGVVEVAGLRLEHVTELHAAAAHVDELHQLARVLLLLLRRCLEELGEPEQRDVWLAQAVRLYTKTRPSFTIP